MGTTDRKAVVGQPQLAQERRGLPLGCPQRQASQPQLPPEFAGQMQVPLEAVELTAGLFTDLG